MNLRELARKYGIKLFGDESKRRIKRLIDSQANQHVQVASFPYSVPAPESRPLILGNVWLKGYDENRVPGTFNIGQMYGAIPAHGKSNGVDLFDEAIDFIHDLNKYNRGNWWAKLVNESNAEYWISRRGGDGSGKQLFIPAPSLFMNNQVCITGTEGRYHRIRCIDLYNLPRADDVRQDPAIVHIYNGWRGGNKFTYFDYPIYVPVIMPGGKAYIEQRLVR